MCNKLCVSQVIIGQWEVSCGQQCFRLRLRQTAIKVCKVWVYRSVVVYCIVYSGCLVSNKEYLCILKRGTIHQKYSQVATPVPIIERLGGSTSVYQHTLILNTFTGGTTSSQLTFTPFYKDGSIAWFALHDGILTAILGNPVGCGLAAWTYPVTLSEVPLYMSRAPGLLAGGNRLVLRVAAGEVGGPYADCAFITDINPPDVTTKN